MEKEVTTMIKLIFKTFGLTLSVVFVIIAVIAMVYVTMWFMFGIAVILLFFSIYYMLQAKAAL